MWADKTALTAPIRCDLCGGEITNKFAVYIAERRRPGRLVIWLKGRFRLPTDEELKSLGRQASHMGLDILKVHPGRRRESVVPTESGLRRFDDPVPPIAETVNGEGVSIWVMRGSPEKEKMSYLPCVVRHRCLTPGGRFSHRWNYITEKAVYERIPSAVIEG